MRLVGQTLMPELWDVLHGHDVRTPTVASTKARADRPRGLSGDAILTGLLVNHEGWMVNLVHMCMIHRC
jgi:hypothetical protein